jgi:hypothetical protein
MRRRPPAPAGAHPILRARVSGSLDGRMCGALCELRSPHVWCLRMCAGRMFGATCTICTQVYR